MALFVAKYKMSAKKRPLKIKGLCSFKLSFSNIEHIGISI
jgi:hypothetical protein